MPTGLLDTPRLVVARVGEWAVGSVVFVGEVALLLVQAGLWLPRALFIGRGRRTGWGHLAFQMDRVGVRSVPVVMLVVFCIGAILALQISPILENYGATGKTADLIAVSIFRELGPLVGAIVLTGFAGASIAAELGTMVVGEEIKALRAAAIHPVRFLVVPRVLATTLMTVCLAVVADLMGVAGGMTASWLTLGTPPLTYLRRSFDAIHLFDFFTGLYKAAVFGLLIGGLACHLGLNVSGGAQGVGRATTRTVVYTIVSLIVVDLLFTTLFYRLEW